MDADLVTYDVEGFHYLFRAALVMDERHGREIFADRMYPLTLAGANLRGRAPKDAPQARRLRYECLC